jgi:hypothetical protein
VLDSFATLWVSCSALLKGGGLQARATVPKEGATGGWAQKNVWPVRRHPCALAGMVVRQLDTRMLHASDRHHHTLHSPNSANVRSAPPSTLTSIGRSADDTRCLPVLPSAPPRPHRSLPVAASNPPARRWPAHTTTRKARVATCPLTR